MVVSSQIQYLENAKKEFEKQRDSSLKKATFLKIFEFIITATNIICGACLTLMGVYTLPTVLSVIIGICTGIANVIRETCKIQRKQSCHFQISGKCKYLLIRIDNYILRMKEQQEYLQNTDVISEDQIKPVFTNEDLYDFIEKAFKEIGEIGLGPFMNESLRRLDSGLN